MSKIAIGVLVTLLLAILSGVYFIGELSDRLKSVEQDKDYRSLGIAQKAAIDDLGKRREEAITRIQQESQKSLALLDIQNQRIAALEAQSSLIEGATRFAFVENSSQCPKGWEFFMKSVTAADPDHVGKAMEQGMERALFNFGGYPGVHSAYCRRTK